MTSDVFEKMRNFWLMIVVDMRNPVTMQLGILEPSIRTDSNGLYPLHGNGTGTGPGTMGFITLSKTVHIALKLGMGFGAMGLVPIFDTWPSDPGYFLGGGANNEGGCQANILVNFSHENAKQLDEEASLASPTCICKKKTFLLSLSAGYSGSLASDLML